MKRPRHLKKKLLLVTFGLLFGLLMTEVFLRVIGYSYPLFYTTDYYRGFALQPGVAGHYQREGESDVRINSDGLRDREHARAKPADTVRIAVLGDSFAEAMHVPMEQTFWSLLERKLQECNAFPGKQVEVILFPPVMSRQVLEESGYWNNFPDQLGTVFSFHGDERRHQRLLKCLDNQEDWTEDVRPTKIVLTPVACYPVYPVMAARDKLPEEGRLVDIFSYCCRHEPSNEPERMLMFRQREFVRLGSPAQALAHRDSWLERGEEVLRSLGLDVRPVVANDPFFGRGGRMMAATQKEQDLKYELVVPVASADKPTAVASCNYHVDHFGLAFGIKTADDKPAHSACIGFGLERVALALFRAHGFEPARWPASVKRVLEL